MLLVDEMMLIDLALRERSFETAGLMHKIATACLIYIRSKLLLLVHHRSKLLVSLAAVGTRELLLAPTSNRLGFLLPSLGASIEKHLQDDVCSFG